MNPETVTPAETILRPAPGRENPLPEWVSTTDRNALPSTLNWGSEADRPPINGRVDVISAGFALGTATVTGYFHSSGELGCWVELDIPLASGERRTYYFGESLTRLDQGDEPTDRNAPTDNADVLDVPVVKDAAAAAVVGGPASDDNIPASDGNDADSADTDADEADEPITLSEDDKDLLD